MNIKLLDNAPLSPKNGQYGGDAGSKEGIIIDGENWIVKYPKRADAFSDVNMSYTTSPLSEYIGSQIYGLLGYDVHQTMLGIRNGKLVVACKDFCDKAELIEFRALKNIYSSEIEELGGSITGTKHDVDLSALLLHFRYNPILSQIPYAEKRFWECSVVDVLINNNDRNNGNWGVLKYQDGTYRLPPVYDNGGAFFNKLTVEKMVENMRHESFEKDLSSSLRTAYSLNGKHLASQKFINLDYEGLANAIEHVAPRFNRAFPEIRDMINEIPERYGSISVMPIVQKIYYLKVLEITYEQLIEPRFFEIENRKEAERNNQQFCSNIERIGDADLEL